MKTIQIAAFALNAALYVALGVALSTIMPISFGGVRFWPQVIIPAAFAVVFGPWVGGLGAGVGIFLSDIMLGNPPLQSLIVGVPANFFGFWLIGFIANKRFEIKKTTVLYGIITALAAVAAYLYTDLIYVGIIVACFVIYGLIVWRKSKWLGFEIGSVAGLAVGSLLIGLTFPIYGMLFAPNVATIPGFNAAGISSLFIWTFATEIPFLLVLGPPIITAIYKAFPTLARKNPKSEIQ
jgi:uncharacterized membrane protein